MIYLLLSLALFLFVLSFHLLKIVRVTKRSIEEARGAFEVIRSPELADEEKEVAARRAALRLSSRFLSILLRSAAAVAISIVPALIAIGGGLFTADEILTAAENGYFLGASFIVVLGLLVVFR